MFADDRLQLYYGDVIDSGFIRLLLNSTHPDELYHFAAQSNVPVSFNNAEYSTEVNALGTLRILEAIKEYLSVKRVKFYNASSNSRPLKYCGCRQKTNSRRRPAQANYLEDPSTKHMTRRACSTQSRHMDYQSFTGYGLPVTIAKPMKCLL